MVTHKVILSFGVKVILNIDLEVDAYETVVFTGTLEECENHLF